MRIGRAIVRAGGPMVRHGLGNPAAETGVPLRHRALRNRRIERRPLEQPSRPAPFHNRPSRQGLLLRISLALALVMPLVACSLFQTPEPVVLPPPPAPPAYDTTLLPSPKPALSPTPGLTDAERLRHAIALLEDGNAAQAKIDLETYLAAVPDSALAQRLLFQIDAPLGTLFPAEHFVVTLQPQQSLSSLSGTYLGEVFGFYALARYNDIAVPDRVVTGQEIRIPATPVALAAQAAQAELSAPTLEDLRGSEEEDIAAAEGMAPALAEGELRTVTEGIVPAPDGDDALQPIAELIGEGRYGAAIREAEAKNMIPTGENAAVLASAYAANARQLENSNVLHAGAQALRAGQLYLEANRSYEAFDVLDLAVRLTPGSTSARAMSDVARREVVEIEYRSGVAAFNRNDLEAAMVHWDRALALDPMHHNSTLNRSQAMELMSARGQAAP
jgi:tetratricopeptide (TPR) repeat protein